MFSRARLRFILFFLTASAVLTIHLRMSSSRLFHRYRLARVEQDRLKQQLWQKQIELEGLIRPQHVYEQLSEEPKP